LGVSVVREYALRLTGPPAKKVFAPIPRPWALGGLEDSPGWRADHETLLHYSVSNACRSWRYAEEGFVSSKDDAAVWALSRAGGASVVDSPWRSGEPTVLAASTAPTCVPSRWASGHASSGYLVDLEQVAR
jgi:hypothetical protein